MQILEWIVWGFLASLAIFLAWGARASVKSGYNFTQAIAIQTFLLWITLVLFLLFGWNKLNLLWTVIIIYIAPHLFARIPIISHMMFIGTWIFMKIILIGCKRDPSIPSYFDL